MFTIDCEPERKLVRAYMKGFLSPDEVADFAREEQRLIREMGCGDGEFLLLIDTSGAVIQSQEVVAAFQQIIMNSPRKARRIAVVRGDSLTRMQTERILSIRDTTAVFQRLDEAEAWLFRDADGGDRSERDVQHVQA